MICGKCKRPLTESEEKAGNLIEAGLCGSCFQNKVSPRRYSGEGQEAPTDLDTRTLLDQGWEGFQRDYYYQTGPDGKRHRRWLT